MSNRYTPKHIQNEFNLSQSTLGKYARLFSSHLSDSANSPSGSGRMYTDEDRKVFATIAEYKNQGMTLDEIDNALQKPYRASVNNIPTELVSVAASDVGLAIIERMQEQDKRIEELETKINEIVLNAHEQIGYYRARYEIERDKNKNADEQ